MCPYKKSSKQFSRSCGSCKKLLYTKNVSHKKKLDKVELDYLVVVPTVAHFEDLSVLIISIALPHALACLFACVFVSGLDS